MKGQTSFEALFILLIILSVTIVITTYFIQTNDLTVATALVRNDLTAQANSFKDPTLIVRVEISLADTNAHIKVDTNPNTAKASDFNWITVKNNILSSTNITSLDINMNGSPTKFTA